MARQPAPKREPLSGGITRITYPSGKVSYEARWDATDESGGRNQGRKSFPTLKLAKAHKAKMEAAIAEGRYLAPTATTMNDYWEIWYARRCRNWATSSQYTNANQWKRHVEPVFGQRRLSSITRSQCQRFVDDLSSRFKPATVGGIYALLNGMLGSAMREGLIQRNPAERLDMPKVVPEPKTAWSDAEVAEFLAATRDHPDHPLYALILATGCRIGEALALSWSNVDLDAGRIRIMATIRRGLHKGGRLPAPGTKSGEDRTVPLTRYAIDILRQHREQQREVRRQAPTWDIRNYVFARTDGRALNYETTAEHLRDVQATMPAGWRVNTFHGMRHTVATSLMRRNVHPVLVQKMLGHKTISITLDTYSHATTDDLEAVVAALEVVNDNMTLKTGRN